MAVTRIYAPEELNRAINRPEVLRMVAPGYESFDLTEFVENRDNIALRYGSQFDAAIAIFHPIFPRVYEGHYLFPSTYRGKRAVKAARAILRNMFTMHCATAIRGRTPRDNRAARIMTRRLGFKPEGACLDTLGRECVKYKLDRKTWDASLA